MADGRTNANVVCDPAGNHDAHIGSPRSIRERRRNEHHPGFTDENSLVTRGEPRMMHRRQRSSSRVKHALIHHLQLGSVRDTDWVAAHFGHR